jgi:hypothetical protein
MNTTDIAVSEWLHLDSATAGKDAEVLRRRRETMLEARRRHPERWIGDTVLNCTPIGRVWLNPEMDSLRKSVCKGSLEQALQLIFYEQFRRKII